MTYRLGTRRRTSVALPRCDVCRGQGLLELAPLPGGRWACPSCRHEVEQRREAATLFDLPATARHPARFTAAHIRALVDALSGFHRVLDPFAGVGTIHRLRSYGHATVGVELEPEWAGQRPGTVVGNALALPFADQCFDAVATSPAYGNRMADHHDAGDASARHTYRHYLGRPLHPASSAMLQWGAAYRAFHVGAWAEASRVVRPAGRFVLNIKDHVRDGQLVRVTDWHLECLERLGWRVVNRWELHGAGLPHGENYDRRAGVEHIVALER